jgi:hypothetical protein
LGRFLLVAGGNPGRFEPVCGRLAKMIYANEVTMAKEAFNQFRDSHVYPSDDEFEGHFAVKYERTSQKAKYFLRRLESQAQTNAKGKMGNEWEQVLPTLEHILPRQPGSGSEWKTVTDDDPAVVPECVNRLGNLCLLTNINRELGSRGFSFKKQTYAKSEVLLTKELASVADWNREAIYERQNHMAKLARSIWRFP